MSNRGTTWFSRIKNSFNNLFTSKSYSFSKENDEFYQKTMKRFGEWHFSKRNVKDKQKILNEIADDGKDIQIIGVIDGFRGQNSNKMKRVVNHVASLWQSYIESTFKSELSKAKSKQTETQSFLFSLKAKRRLLVSNQATINAHHNANSKKYSLILGLVYVGISFFLIRADFPLSIQVVKEGFDIADDQESVNLALGIVLITIYFKIFYDEYLGTSTFKTLLNSKIPNLLMEGNESSEDLLRKAKTIYRTKLAVKIVILTALVITLYLMGSFRSEYMSTVPDHSNAYKTLMDSSTTKYLFILLSIMFPIIGGICASIGVNMLQNKFDRFRIWLQLRIQDKKIAAYEKRNSLAMSAVQSCESNLDWAKPENGFTEDCAAYFFSYYLHGYEWGMRLKIPDDLYGAAKHIRKQDADVNLTSRYFKSMPEDAPNMKHQNGSNQNKLN